MWLHYSKRRKRRMYFFKGALATQSNWTSCVGSWRCFSANWFLQFWPTRGAFKTYEHLFISISSYVQYICTVPFHNKCHLRALHTQKLNRFNAVQLNAIQFSSIIILWVGYSTPAYKIYMEGQMGGNLDVTSISRQNQRPNKSLQPWLSPSVC